MNENPESMTQMLSNQSESISTANVDRHNTDTKIIEFMQDLKEAIQNGEFQRYEQRMENKENGEKTSNSENNNSEQPPIASMASLINVNNLSNQTFNYIINWLKQQQMQQLEENKDNLQQKTESDIKFEQINGDHQEASEAQMLRNQVQLAENEKEKLLNKFKELQEENMDLKSKLIGLKNISYNNSQFQDISNENGHTENKSDAQLISEKDFEIERLNRIIEELVKSNEEKERRCDELTKQVSRFKRIQEIVLSAQTNTHYKNKIDLDFDTNSDSNSLPSINGDDLSNQILSNVKQHIKTNPKHSQGTSSGQNNQISSPKQFQNGMSNSMVLASNINQACSLISSCSLSSSLSSSSTASSASSNSSAQQNGTNLVAPLATISELNHSCSNDPNRKSQSMDHYNTLPSSLNTLNESKRSLTEISEMEVSKFRSMNKLNSCKSSSNASSNTMVNDLNNQTNENVDADQTSNKKGTNFSQNLEIFKMNKKNKKGGSINSLNNDLVKKACQQTDKNDKYLSNCSVNRTSKQSLSGMKKQQSVPPQTKTSPSHNSNSIKSFFGKLIRTSLVNINESSFSISNTLDSKHKMKSKQESFDDSMNRSSNSNPFKRGGTRATANARLQNNSFSLSNSCLTQIDNNNRMHFLGDELNTLTFAKWSSDQVYDWLYKNGFDAYFPYSSDGYIGHKWIKNGLHLLQASQYDYEKELGIKNPLHRKRLALLLQSMYNAANFTKLEINYTNYIDQLWVTKWLDDIGLPQYKDVFNHSKIDGMMLNNLTNEDLQSMNIQSELHYLSIKRAVHVLRLKEFDPHCLRRRPSGDELLDKSEVILWTNHRIMEWLRSIDLSEYAPNLRGSGVHGALMVFEGRFNSTVLADILAIPASKTLIRRHLNTLFIDLIGPQMYQHKCETEAQSNYQPLTASTKLKLSKRGLGVGLFSHKRAKSQDREFLSAPILKFDNEFKNYDNIHTNNLSAPVNAMIASFREETEAFDKEISMGQKLKSNTKERNF